MTCSSASARSVLSTLALSVMQRGVAAKDQQVAQSRKEQEELLGALERLARAPPEALAFAPEGPVDRLRSGILIAAAVPALTAQARELPVNCRVGAVRKLIDARRKDIDDARARARQGARCAGPAVSPDAMR
jgi:septal ring factor EnvC (AmiA/AmiB activator)